MKSEWKLKVKLIVETHEKLFFLFENIIDILNIESERVISRALHIFAVSLPTWQEANSHHNLNNYR